MKGLDGFGQVGVGQREREMVLFQAFFRYCTATVAGLLVKGSVADAHSCITGMCVPVQVFSGLTKGFHCPQTECVTCVRSMAAENGCTTDGVGSCY